MNWPAISILIPLSNGRSAERTVASAQCQAYPGKIEVVNSSESLDELNSRVDDLEGDLLSIQRSGDFYLPEAFTRSASLLVRDSTLPLVSGCEVHLQPDGTTLRASALTDEPIDPRSLMLGRPVPRQCVFLWRQAFRAVGGYRAAAAADPAIDLHYRLLHEGDGQFIPYHTAVHQLDAVPPITWDRRWLASMRDILDSCDADPSYSSRFQLNAADKLNLLRRWLLLEARQAGNEARVSELLAELMTGSDADTRSFLVRHGFVPMQSDDSDSFGMSDADQLRNLVDWSLDAMKQQRRVA